MEVIAYQHGNFELVYDTDDIEEVSTNRDVVVVPSEGLSIRHELGPHSYLRIKFQEGKQAEWRVKHKSQQSPRSRSCPTCHSIGAPGRTSTRVNDICTDTWHSGV